MPKKEVKEEPVDEYEEELFFNQDSYKLFTKKHGIELLSSDIVTSNDLHKEVIIMPKEKRITSEIMTLAEYTRVISERAKQIDGGSIIFIDVNETDPIKIAELEIIQKKSPMLIIRHITKNIIEIWPVREMIVPFQ